jgi:hypothetical protein
MTFVRLGIIFWWNSRRLLANKIGGVLSLNYFVRKARYESRTEKVLHYYLRYSSLVPGFRYTPGEPPNFRVVNVV